MQQRKYVPKPIAEVSADPFDDAQEAWFWYVRCQQLRDDGGSDRTRAIIRVRPCDPDDLYRAVVRLARDGKIGRKHLGVLQRFGIADRPPDPRCREEEQASRLWDEALDRLTTVLRQKGIVREPGPSHGGQQQSCLVAGCDTSGAARFAGVRGAGS